MKKSVLSIIGLVIAFLFAAAPAQAAVTWDFSGVTGELAGLGTALLAAGGIAVSGALVLFGIKRAIGFVLGLFSKTAAK